MVAQLRHRLLFASEIRRGGSTQAGAFFKKESKLLQPNTYFGLVARRDATAPSGVRYVRVYEIYLDAPVPSDRIVYRGGELEQALLWGTNLKQLKNFATYLFGKGDLQVTAKPLRHDPRLALFSSRN